MDVSSRCVSALSPSEHGGEPRGASPSPRERKRKVLLLSETAVVHGFGSRTLERLAGSNANGQQWTEVVWLCGAGETVVCVASSNSIYRTQQSSLSTLLSAHDDTRSFTHSHIHTFALYMYIHSRLLDRYVFDDVKQCLTTALFTARADGRSESLPPLDFCKACLWQVTDASSDLRDQNQN